MTKEEFLEGNALIAKYMGFIPMTMEAWQDWIDRSDEDNVYWVDYTNNYHNNWNLLMPVVDVIESKGFPIEICIDSCAVYDASKTGNGEIIRFNVENSKATSKLGRLYELIVEFIIWYNETQKSES